MDSGVLINLFGLPILAWFTWGLFEGLGERRAIESRLERAGTVLVLMFCLRLMWGSLKDVILYFS